MASFKCPNYLKVSLLLIDLDAVLLYSSAHNFLPSGSCSSVDSLHLPHSVVPTTCFCSFQPDIQMTQLFPSVLSQARQIPVPQAGPRKTRMLQASLLFSFHSKGGNWELGGFFLTVLWEGVCGERVRKTP